MATEPPRLDLAEFFSTHLFAQPALVSPLSAWNEHIPFAAWIVEALRPRTLVELGVHTGVSYFALCEPVRRLGLDARCYAVDHWRGDPHSGEYGEDIYEAVSSFNNQHYPSFSTLLRKTFDDAVDDFGDGQIDLLHIDGYHTYEAVKNDFDNWLPKMSSLGVVLLHDTAEQKDDFGVYRLVKELRQQYPVFEFRHGHGLAVAGVGREIPERVRSLIGLEPDSRAAQLIRELYQGLGQRLSLEVEPVQMSDTSSEERTNRTASRSQVRSSEDRVGQLENTIDSQDREREALIDSVEAQHRIIAELRASLAAAQQDIDDLRSSTSWRVTAPVRAIVDKARWTGWKLRALTSGVDSAREPGIKRLYQRFDRRLDKATRRELRDHLRSNPVLGDMLVSVIMPTHNRAQVIGQSIESVLRQTHKSWELLIVDDGSTDDTESAVSPFLDDARIRYLKRTRGGVGAARNEGLKAASGDIIAYLDSDNQWDREFLTLMVAGLDDSGHAIAFSATALVENGEITGYRGDEFDFEKCLDANYIDINSFCHTRDLVTNGVRFEPKIRRTNDWDFILTLTYGREVAYIPFVGVRYTQSERPDQITLKEPYVFRRLVEARHRRRYEESTSDLESFEDVLDRFPMSVAIRTAAPFDDRHLWGDHHLAVGLAQALSRLGHHSQVYYLDQEPEGKYDVVLVLRGLTEYLPTPDSVNVVWNISHPDRVSFEELDSYSIVCVASPPYASLLSLVMDREVIPLLQGTDVDRFHLQEVERERHLLFVGNSRRVERPVVRYSLEAGLPLVLHGSGWEGMVPDAAVASNYLPNEDAGKAYAAAGAVLNDHWESMKDFGFVSNRVFDALASGAVVISDSFPELERIFGDKVATFSTRTEFLEQAQRLLASPPARETLVATAREVVENHSLDVRALALLDTLHEFLGDEPAADGPGIAETRRLRGLIASHVPTRRIAVIPQMPVPGRMSSSAYIRLIQPLTSDLGSGPVDLKVIEPDESMDVGPNDLVVVSRTAMASVGDGEELLELTDSGSRLAVDIDDAFHMMDESHPQFDDYRDRVAALMLLAAEAAMVWCSTEPLKQSLPSDIRDKATVVANTMDPRLWRRYRKSTHTTRVDDRLELLYTGTLSHVRDLELVMPAFRALEAEYPGSFRLTVIGLPTDSHDPHWLHRLYPPSSAYPFFARWLRDIAGDFDLGIAPLLDTQFNRLKSDIKILEYTALGLPSIVSPIGPYRDLEGVDQCDSDDAWYKAFAMTLTNRGYLDERRIQLEHVEASMWQRRASASAGESILSLISTHAGR